jgi:hypothetical protein
MINKKFVAIVLAVGLLLSIGCVVSQQRALNQLSGWQAERLPGAILGNSEQQTTQPIDMAEIGISPGLVEDEQEYDSIPSYSPPSYTLMYDLTGTWQVSTTNEVLVIIQSGNMIEGTMEELNKSAYSLGPDLIAGTIYPGGKVEFTRTHRNGETEQYSRYSGVVSGTPGSLLSMEGITGYPGQYYWKAVKQGSEILTHYQSQNLENAKSSKYEPISSQVLEPRININWISDAGVAVGNSQRVAVSFNVTLSPGIYLRIG